MTNERFPLSLCLNKKGEMAYFSQIDLVRILERALRRAGLPVYYTQGFTPRVKLSFSHALKLGKEGEIGVTFYFTRMVSFEDITRHLTPQLPQGISLTLPNTT
jgi:radical SAM-linked protein